MHFLTWTIEKDNFLFSVSDSNGQLLPVEKWALDKLEVGNGIGSLAPLLARVDDGAELIDNTCLSLSYKQVAYLENDEVLQLGLPPAAPFRLAITGDGILARPGFKIYYSFLLHDGRPVMGLEQQGPLCTFAGKNYLLLEPLYSIIAGIDNFSRLSEAPLDERMVAWGEIKELLPDECIVDDQLKSVNIMRADRFTLDIRADHAFDPVLISSGNNYGDVSQDVASNVKQSLPDHYQTAFAKQFISRAEAQPHYALGHGWYAIIPRKLQDALAVAKENQGKDRAARKSFLANPQAFINKALGNDLTDDDSVAEIEALFVETPEFLSKRIECLGVWEPRLCAYKMPVQNQWLPNEDVILNIPVGDTVLELPSSKVQDALDAVKNAVDSGQSEVEINGQQMPVSPELEDKLRRVAEGSKKSTTIAEKKCRNDKLVPRIVANMEEADFVKANRTGVNALGGVPAILKTSPLYSHQEDGLQWLQKHWITGSPGALLADDMGLGKTLQALAFMAWVGETMSAGSYEKKPFLIVAPTGLLKNWEDEADTHLVQPGLGNILRAYGAGLHGFDDLGLIRRRERFLDADWVMTTYETLRDKIEYFLPVQWGVAVFDEAQKIKNPVSRMTEMSKSLSVDFTLIMTGTPVENELKDIWSIMDAARPGELGSLKEFHNKYVKPTLDDHNSQAEELKNLLVSDSDPSLMLRRMKVDHLEGLPEKKNHLHKFKMPSQQVQAYDEIIAYALHNKGQRGVMLEVIQKLRGCSLFPEEVGQEGLTDEAICKSARLSAMVEVLDSVSAKKEKALLFLESLKLQELLVPYLQYRYRMARPPMIISGKIAGDKRKERVDRFQAGREGEFDVMILSPKAGGVGLTLTAANHVLHLSRWWNPAVEDQCTDRVYRIGQKKTVNVYHLMAIHPRFNSCSFDENLHDLLERKRDLSRKVLLPASFDQNDISSLFAKSVEN